MGLGGVSFIGEADFCRNSLLRWVCPFFTYNFGRPGGVFSTSGAAGFFAGTDEDFRFRFSACNFFVGIVSMGGGSGLVRSETGWEGAELCDVREGEGSENGERMLFGRGAKPRT